MRFGKARLGALVSACLLVAVPLTALGVASDDDVPGIPLPPSGFTQSLDAANSVEEQRDVTDLYEIELVQGQWFYASMKGDSGTDFDLYLFAPGTTSASGSTPAVAYSERQGTSSERILYRATVSGTHYFEIHAFGGAGTYRITHGSPAETPVVTMSPPASVKWGATASVKGALHGSKGPISGATIQLYAREAGSSSWRKAATAKTDAAGLFATKVTPKKKTTYQARYLGSSDHLPAKAADRSVAPLAYLTRPTAPATVRQGVTFTSKGYLKPRHTAGAKSVKVLCYRKERQSDGSLKYVLRRSFSAVNADYGTYTKYSARVTLPSKGTWKLAAKVGGDSIHAATVTRGRYRIAY